jgi:hypothetical protein
MCVCLSVGALVCTDTKPQINKQLGGAVKHSLGRLFTLNNLMILTLERCDYIIKSSIGWGGGHRRQIKGGREERERESEYNLGIRG